jgi:hypothetical protein
MNEESSQPEQAEPGSEHVVSMEERRFWERMTFRQFAILIVRLQGVMLLLYATTYATYLPRYFVTSGMLSSFSVSPPAMRLEFFLSSLRLMIHVAAGFALILRGEWVLSWLVKDCVAKQSPEKMTKNPPDMEGQRGPSNPEAAG